MGSIYDYIFYDYGYHDEVPFIRKKCCDGDCGGRSEEQKEIDNAQDKALEKEVQRSTTIDSSQDKKIVEINEKIKEINTQEWIDA